ncbi:MAG TPA: hypothetical protein VGK52_00775 [Polyangia bacterium]
MAWPPGTRAADADKAATTSKPSPPDVPAPPSAPATPAPAVTAPGATTAVTAPGATTAVPADAEAALERARAAYEYGEMEMVVDSARLVAEGRLHPTPAQRAQALRYLGIGLFLTDRQEGAETAFFDLLRLRPHTRLEATTTRPDVVAFFENVRRRHAAEINEAASNRPGKNFALAFLPPLGQFQSGHKARGITFAALEVLSLGAAIATDLQLRAWDKYPGHTFMPLPGQPGESHADAARTLKTLNYASLAVFAATIVIGIVDGVASYVAVEPEDTGTSLADVFLRGIRF